MALRISDDDQRYNPHADEQFNNTAKKLRDAEESSDFNKNNDSIQNHENNPADNWSPKSDWKNNVTGKNTKSSNSSRFKFFKKKGPLTAIILTLVGGGIGISGLLSPGLLIVHLKEVMVDKFNTQLTSMDIRTNKLLSAKATGGIFCDSVVNISCKYSSMSAAEISNFENAKITVIAEEINEKGIYKPTSFKFNNETITANEFAGKIKTSIEFRSAVKNAYNPKFAGLSDEKWGKAANSLKISKKPPTIEGDTFEEKISDMGQSVKETTGIKETPLLSSDDIDPATGKKFSEAGEEALTLANEEITKLNSIIKEVGSSETSLASKLLSGGKEVVNTVKITAIPDAACTIYRTSKAVGYAAKTVRVAQVAFYAMMFLNVADQIKAGVAKAEDVSFLGTILTKESPNDSGELKSATDSFGYKYAAYNETGNMQASSMMFMAGAGFSGGLIGILDAFVPSVMSKGCMILGNPIVGAVSLIVGGALAFFTAGEGTAFLAGLKVAAKEALTHKSTYFAAGLALGEVFLPELLKDILAGNLVDETTVGSFAGDAITSGASGIMGTAAKYGGNSPLTPNEAVAYNKLSEQVAYQYAEEDRLNSDPLDINNKNTFIGSFFYKMSPYLSKISSVSSAFSSMSSMATNSLSSIFYNNTYAESADQYSLCQDETYRKLGLATDPYCNVMYGIPVDALEEDPIEVANKLLNLKQGDLELKQIDEISGQPVEKYSEFVSKCINRSIPLGESSDELTSFGDGSECLFGKEILIKEARTVSKTLTYPAVYLNNKYFYLHYIDQRIQDGMDGTDKRLAAAKSSGLNSISFFDNSNYNITALSIGGN